MYKIFIGITAISIILLTGCGQAGKDKTETAGHYEQPMPTSSTDKSIKGKIVSNDEVCMVNDAYMGKKQLEVKVNGNTYYGCCEMCKERIPKDASVRLAIDPFSQKQVDKSTAIIAVTGDNGEVSYFENKANFTNYLKQH
ncbi:hypothetical protein [Sphingobacterium sp.]|uniref:hypothetical protein n=1 Tax=Sphingobacterium sp. TaxID=341027 RepID=UPI00289AD7AB|nr:hypothetical protein [Sphingobacterium sp.]